MIGKEFQHTGKSRNITHRVGDGNGDPFLGPLKLCSLRRGVIAVLTKDHSIFIRQLRGITDHIYYPVSAKASVLSRRSVRNLLKLIEDTEEQRLPTVAEESAVNGTEDTLKTTLSAAHSTIHNRKDSILLQEDDNADDEDYETEISAPFTFLDMQPLSISRVEGKNALAITDNRFCVHILDLDIHEITQTFGKGGTNVGEFVQPTAVHTALLHTSINSADPPKLHYFVGDSQITQKVRVFDQDCIQIAEIGGMGPRKGQFNNIASISTFDPFIAKSVTSQSHPTTQPSSSAHTSMALVPYADDTYDSDSVTSIIGAAGENTPSWYRGEQSIEVLEDMMYADNFKGNFLMALDKPFEYPDDEQLLLTDAECSSKKYLMTTQNSINAVYIEKMYNILYITQQQRLGHIVVKESTNPAYGVGFYIHNNNDPNRVYYECIYDLLYAQKECKFTLGGDTRKYAYISVCDQGNYRVQVFCFYWTKSIIYKPELKLAYVIGGIHRKYIELFDPVCAAYAPTGELAICDGGSCKIHILSPTMQLIQRICLPFVSLNDLPVLTVSKGKSTVDKQKQQKGVNMQKTVQASSSAAGADTSPEKPLSSKAAGTVTLSDRELHTAGIDYLHCLNCSLASHVNFNEREKRGDPPPTKKKKKFNRGTASSSAFTNSTFSGSSLVPTATSATITNTNTNSSSIGALDNNGNNDSNSMKIVKLSALKSTKHPGFDTTSSSVTAGGKQNTFTSNSSVTTGSILTLAEPGARTQFAPPAVANANANAVVSDPTLLAAQRRRRANRTPCSVCYSAEGQLLVGYKSGGVYAFSPYDTYPMGDLEILPVTALEHALQYLCYTDIESLRNCCLYLHNLTRDLRLTWRLFPSARAHMETRVVSVFLECAKLDVEGFEKPDFVLRDENLNAICERHLKLECDNAFCSHSHQPLRYDRSELAPQAGYIVYADFIHALSVIFGPKFLWKYELYIEKLYDAYGTDQQVVSRHDNMSRKNETVRAKHVETVRVLRFLAYLEVMALLEEQYSDLKQIHSHKLFHHMPRAHYVPKVDYALFKIDRRMVIDPCEQYDRPIDVPFKKIKGVKLITLKGMEGVQRSRTSAVEEHTAVFECHADKAASLINKLFS